MALSPTGPEKYLKIKKEISTCAARAVMAKAKPFLVNCEGEKLRNEGIKIRAEGY
jgi:hypothetical protein